jgi:hypothetical protein
MLVFSLVNDTIVPVSTYWNMVFWSRHTLRTHVPIDLVASEPKHGVGSAATADGRISGQDLSGGTARPK